MIKKGIIESALSEKEIQRTEGDPLYSFSLLIDIATTSKEGVTHHDRIMAEKVVKASYADSERQKIAEMLGKELNLVLTFDVKKGTSGGYFQNIRFVEARL